MTAETIKAQKIVSEIYLFCKRMGATEINMDYKETDDSYIMHIKSNFDESNIKLLDTLNKYLCVPRQEEMEGYYWELTGNYTDDSALAIVGMMTDEVDISYENNHLEVYLVRMK